MKTKKKLGTIPCEDVEHVLKNCGEDPSSCEHYSDDEKRAITILFHHLAHCHDKWEFKNNWEDFRIGESGMTAFITKFRNDEEDADSYYWLAEVDHHSYIPFPLLSDENQKLFVKKTMEVPEKFRDDIFLDITGFDVYRECDDCIPCFSKEGEIRCRKLELEEHEINEDE